MRCLPLLAVLTLTVTLSPSPVMGDPERQAFQPSQSSIDEALKEFSAYPKKAPFLGAHDAKELHPDQPITAIYGGSITPESMAKRREQYQKDGKVPSAEWVDYWMALSDEEIYAMISPENPRALVPNYTHGYPLAQGSISSLLPIWGRRDHHRSTLDGSDWGPGITVRNPTSGEAVEITDDGWGWIPPEGFPNRSAFRFKAAYRNYLIRKLIYFPYNGEIDFDGPSYRQHASPVYALAFAYAVTGKQAYADRALLILGRLAETYRHYTSNDDTGWEWSKDRYRGYIDDHNNECALIVNMALAYDLVWEAVPKAQAVTRFLHDKGGETSPAPEEFRAQIERNLFGYTWEFLKRNSESGVGNTSIRHMATQIHLACVFRNDKLIDHLLHGTRGLSDRILGGLYREGRYHEDSSWYAQHVVELLLDALDPLAIYRGEGPYKDGIKLPPEVKSRLAKAKHWHEQENIAGRAFGIGDSPSPRQKVWKPTGEAPRAVEAHEMGLTLMPLGNDEAQRHHVLLYHSNAAFGHGHFHQLMLKLFAYGYDFSADLGYPANFTNPKWAHWTKATLTHPTVVIDRRHQRESSSATRGLRVSEGWLEVASAFSRDAYEEADLYHRTAIAIEEAPGKVWVIDLFRVSGGKRHDLAFHSLSGETGDLLSLSGEVPELKPLPPFPQMKDSGHHYLLNPKGGKNRGAFSARWYTGDEEETGFAIHVPAEFDGEIITAKGEAEGHPGKSPLDAYLLLSRQGKEPLESTFVTIHEAFQGKGAGVKLKQLPVEANLGQWPIRLEVVTEAGKRFEVTSFLSKKSAYESALLHEALEVKVDGKHLRVNWPSVKGKPNPMSGTVVDCDYSSRKVILDTQDDLSDVQGKFFHVGHPEYVKATSFTIAGSRKLADGRWELELDEDALIGSASVLSIEKESNEIRSRFVTEKIHNALRLVDGKTVFKEGDPHPYRIARMRLAPAGQTPTHQFMRLHPAPAGSSEWKEGDRYRLFDFGVGDTWWINRLERNH